MNLKVHTSIIFQIENLKANQTKNTFTPMINKSVSEAYVLLVSNSLQM